MLIAIDLDGVLVDVINPLLRYYNNRYGTKIRFGDVKSYDLYKVWGGTREDDVRKILDFFKTEYAKRIKPIEGSVAGVKKLGKNSELMLISSRPHEVKEETNETIKKYFTNIFSGIFLTNQFSLNGKSVKKSEICLKYGADAIIEDSVENAIDCCGKGIDTILIDYPWNRLQKIDGIQRVKNWEEIIAYFL